MRAQSPPRAQLLGDPRALEAALVAAIERRAARVFVVAPTRRLCDHLARVATLRLGALAGVHFFVHRTLARHLLDAAPAPFPGHARVRELPAPFAQRLFLDRLDRLDTPRARYLREQPAALAPLFATFRDLRDAGVAAVAAAQVEPLSATARATLALFGEFERLLADLEPLGFVDGAALATRARTLVAQGEPPCDLLLHHGAYDLIGVHRDLIAALAARVPTELLIPMPITARAPLELARALGAEVVASEPAVALARASTLTSTAGRREELRFALRRLLQWHQQDGVPFDEMAVLTRSGESYAVALAAEAALLEIAPDHSLELSLATHPAAVVVVRELDALARPDDPMADERAQRSSPLAATTRAELATRFRSARSLAARLAVVRAVAEALVAGGLAAEPLVELFTGAEAMAEELGAHGLGVGRPTGPGADTVAGTDAVEFARQLLDAAPARARGDEAGSVRVLDFQQARALPLRRAVLIGCNEQLLPHRTAEDFFLPDADRARLAAALARPLPIKRDAADDERLLFAVVRSGISERLEATFARADGERELAPSPWLRELTDVPARKAELIARHPAREIEALHALTGLLRREEALVVAASVSAASALALLPRLPARDADAPAAFARSAAMVARIDDYGDELAATGALAWDADGIPLPPKASWSPSELQSLGRCPLRYFFDHELELEPPLQSWRGELDRRVLGSLLHDVLRDLYRELFAPEPAGGLRADALAHARARLPELIARRLEESGANQELAAWLAPIRIKQWSAQLAEFVADDLARLRERGVTGGEFELSPQPPPEVELGGAAPRLTLRLRFDRIVRDAAGREWIGDYKLKTPEKLKKIASPEGACSGRELQLPLYRLARRAAIGDERIAGLELLALEPARRGASSRSIAIELEELRAKDAEIAATLATLIALRTAGSFPLQPQDDLRHGQCGTCDWRRACRHAHGPTRSRVAAAPHLAAYYALSAKAPEGRER